MWVSKDRINPTRRLLSHEHNLSFYSLSTFQMFLSKMSYFLVTDRAHLLSDLSLSISSLDAGIKALAV